ncbi:outer membrane beta-barrel protein [Fulvivirga ligni]|uniref:outer membrane beta-barrel protein n=1 Tax=Fulvivirga ligni TaxID=2904246 RepID=UPI001F3CCF6A|nr:outer membrane beta-barrel protein [Fulvivirga ligni]UII19297.1 PorT family protein [Fulvivirga ligni]
MKHILAAVLSVLLVFTITSSFGQKKNKMYYGYQTKKAQPGDKFLNSQWWLGFRAGANITEVTPTQSYSAFSPISYDLKEKEYNTFGLDQISGQAGIEITFYHKGFSFSLQPNYRRQRFTYINEYEWKSSIIDTLATNELPNQLNIQYTHENTLDYIELPIFIKYDLTRGNLRPFIQIGGYYGTLVGADRHLKTSGTDRASGAIGPFKNQETVIGAKDFYIKSSVGIAGGIGVSYDFWNVRLVFDATYRYGMANITSTKNRYSKNELVGIGDAMDDIEMSNISCNIGLLFPLRFISSKYDSFN